MLLVGSELCVASRTSGIAHSLGELSPASQINKCYFPLSRWLPALESF